LALFLLTSFTTIKQTPKTLKQQIETASLHRKIACIFCRRRRRIGGAVIGDEGFLSQATAIPIEKVRTLLPGTF
jgi:hypothetical protein